MILRPGLLKPVHGVEARAGADPELSAQLLREGVRVEGEAAPQPEHVSGGDKFFILPFTEEIPNCCFTGCQKYF